MAKVQKRFCILGCQHGHISSVINGLTGLGWELEFIADRDPWLAEKLCEKHGAPLEKDWQKALAKSASTVAAVAAVNCAKGELIASALLAGKHVVADKPLVIDYGNRKLSQGLSYRLGQLNRPRHVGIIFHYVGNFAGTDKANFARSH